MRPTLLVSALLVVAAAHAGGTSVDLRGTARAGERPLPDAVVWLDAPNAPPMPAARAVLDQRSLTFSPHVLAVRVGTRVEFPNHDRVLHNVFSFHDGARFDLGLYPVEATKYVRFDSPGLSRIFCNIHANMTAYVLAVDSPYFAVTGRTGEFSIAAVPPGSYTYHAWRPGGTDLTGRLTVPGDSPLEVRWP